MNSEYYTPRRHCPPVFAGTWLRRILDGNYAKQHILLKIPYLSHHLLHPLADWAGCSEVVIALYTAIWCCRTEYTSMPYLLRLHTSTGRVSGGALFAPRTRCRKLFTISPEMRKIRAQAASQRPHTFAYERKDTQQTSETYTIASVATTRLAGSDDFDNLPAPQAEVSRDGIGELDARQLRLLEAVTIE